MIYLKSIKLKNFRLHAQAEMEFSEGVNIIIGDNGVGKTSIVEAIFYFSASSSFRTNNRKDLLRHKSEVARITESIVVNSKIISATKDIPTTIADESLIKTTVFSPEVVGIISGDPEGRRNFIDNIIRQYDRNYSNTLLKFKKLIKQRVESVKQDSMSKTLDIWNERYARYSENISQKRAHLVMQINQRIRLIYQQLAQSNDEVSVTFMTNPHEIHTIRIIEELVQNFESELKLGYTTIGAKSDDVRICLNSILAKESASYGEKWTIALSLVLATHEIMQANNQKHYNTCPLLILDDVFTGLDSKRCSRLIARLKQYHQIIITCADTKKIPQKTQYNAILLSK